MEIIDKKIADLIPYARNARTHDDRQVALIAGSIREFGFRNPILIDGQSGIIAGHGRVMALQKLGHKTAACIDCSDMSDAQKRAYIIADNKLAELAGWDDELLALELAELEALDVDLEALGFDENELNALMTDGDQQEGEDDTPELDDENVVSTAGDIWILGRHRIKCGDSTSEDDVAALLNGVAPHLMVTDPPYGVSYDPTWRDQAGGQFGDGKTKMRGAVKNDDRADWTEAWSLFPGQVAYVWHGALHAGEVAQSLQSAGFEVRSQIIWKKQHFTLCRGDYHWGHEPCWYAVKGKSCWAAGRDQSTVWDISSLNPSGRSQDIADVKLGHGTQKPVECMRRPIINNSSPGQAVYEPFSGSGTTIIAAETTERVCYAMELHPPYVDLAVRRWQTFTGERAIHAETGEPFDAGDLRAA